MPDNLSPEVKSENDIKVEPGVKVDPEVKVEPSVDSEPNIKSAPDLKPEPNIQVEPDHKPDRSIESKPGLKSEPDIDLAPDAPVVSSQPALQETPAAESLTVQPEPEARFTAALAVAAGAAVPRLPSPPRCEACVATLLSSPMRCQNCLRLDLCHICGFCDTCQLYGAGAPHECGWFAPSPDTGYAPVSPEIRSSSLVAVVYGEGQGGAGAAYLTLRYEGRALPLHVLRSHLDVKVGTAVGRGPQHCGSGESRLRSEGVVTSWSQMEHERTTAYLADEVHPGDRGRPYKSRRQLATLWYTVWGVSLANGRLAARQVSAWAETVFGGTWHYSFNG